MPKEAHTDGAGDGCDANMAAQHKYEPLIADEICVRLRLNRTAFYGQGYVIEGQGQRAETHLFAMNAILLMTLEEVFCRHGQQWNPNTQRREPCIYHWVRILPPAWVEPTAWHPDDTKTQCSIPIGNNIETFTHTLHTTNELA